MLGRVVFEGRVVIVSVGDLIGENRSARFGNRSTTQRRPTPQVERPDGLVISSAVGPRSGIPKTGWPPHRLIDSMPRIRQDFRVNLVPSPMQSHGSHSTIHSLLVGCRRAFRLWIAIVVLLPPMHGCSRLPSINEEVAREAAGLIEVEVSPPFRFHFDRMQEGVLQHLDREYTSDFVPPEPEGGILFQGIHRPPAGTGITLKLLAPATLYFFFHDKVHGGYDRIFAGLESWQACDDFPK